MLGGLADLFASSIAVSDRDDVDAVVDIYDFDGNHVTDFHPVYYPGTPEEDPAKVQSIDFDPATGDIYSLAAFGDVVGHPLSGIWKRTPDGTRSIVTPYYSLYPSIDKGADITVLPEPSTLVLLFTTAVGLLVCGWRKRRG